MLTTTGKLAGLDEKSQGLIAGFGTIPTTLERAYCSSWVQPIHGPFSDIPSEVMATLPQAVRDLL